jgi:hypothetical protein
VVRVRLEVKAVEQQVTVSTQAPQLNTTTPSVLGLVGDTEVKELPLNGQSFDKIGQGEMRKSSVMLPVMS